MVEDQVRMWTKDIMSCSAGVSEWSGVESRWKTVGFENKDPSRPAHTCSTRLHKCKYFKQTRKDIHSKKPQGSSHI